MYEIILGKFSKKRLTKTLIPHKPAVFGFVLPEAGVVGGNGERLLQVVDGAACIFPVMGNFKHGDEGKEVAGVFK